MGLADSEKGAQVFLLVVAIVSAALTLIIVIRGFGVGLKQNVPKQEEIIRSMWLPPPPKK